jgi:hypothetical protein
LEEFNKLVGMKTTSRKVFDKYDITYFENVNTEMRNNKEFMMYVVGTTPLSLRFASKSLQNDFDVVSKAVLKDANSLEFASDELKNNKKIIMRKFLIREIA